MWRVQKAYNQLIYNKMLTPPQKIIKFKTNE